MLKHRFLAVFVALWAFVLCFGCANPAPLQMDQGHKNQAVQHVSNAQFRSAQLFNNHYTKHVLQQKEFGSISKEEYLHLAQTLVSQKEGGSILVKHKSNGDTLFFDKKSGEFAVLSGDGYIRTFFKPQDGVAYFNRQ
jgi:pyocin large subunit-like protein